LHPIVALEVLACSLFEHIVQIVVIGRWGEAALLYPRILAGVIVFFVVR
jgi:hypothetical protein